MTANQVSVNAAATKRLATTLKGWGLADPLARAEWIVAEILASGVAPPPPPPPAPTGPGCPDAVRESHMARIRAVFEDRKVQRRREVAGEHPGDFCVGGVSNPVTQAVDADVEPVGDFDLGELAGSKIPRSAPVADRYWPERDEDVPAVPEAPDPDAVDPDDYWTTEFEHWTTDIEEGGGAGDTIF